MRYGISYGNGNDGVSRLFPAYVVEAPEGSEFLITKLAVLSNGYGVSRRYLSDHMMIDEAGENATTATILNPPRSRNWSDHNGAWVVVEVYPADEFQSANSEANEYESLNACFGRQLVRAHRKDEPVMVPQPVQQQQANAAIIEDAVKPSFPDFGSYVYHGMTVEIEHEGFILTAHVINDDDAAPPWENDCGHGPVSDWTTRAKALGELVLCSDGSSKRFYDFAEAYRIARIKGWETRDGRRDGESLRAYSARAAMEDYNNIKAWCNDEWNYVGISVSVSKNDVELVDKYDCALWCIEANYPDGNNSYLKEVANEHIDEALKLARERLASLIED